MKKAILVTVEAPDGTDEAGILSAVEFALDDPANYGNHDTSEWTDVAVGSAEPETITGDDVTAGAGPDATCGCGEAITYFEGAWLHIFNPELRGTDDHEAEPDDPDSVDWSEYEDEEPG